MTPAANGETIIDHPGVDHSVIVFPTEWASHAIGDFQVEHRPSPSGERVPSLYSMPGGREQGFTRLKSRATADHWNLPIRRYNEHRAQPASILPEDATTHDRILQRLWRRSVGGSRLLSPLWTAAQGTGPAFRPPGRLTAAVATGQPAGASRPRRRRCTLRRMPRCRAGEAEQTLWEGGYSAKAMLGGWLLAALVTVVATGIGMTAGVDRDCSWGCSRPRCALAALACT